MKNLFLFLSVIFSLSSVSAQNNQSMEIYGLALENTINTSRPDLLVKPDRKIKIKTLDGRIIQGSDYTLIRKPIDQNTLDSVSNDFIVMNTWDADTVSLGSVLWIKGRVAKDKGRKIVGGIMTAVSIPLLFVPLYAAAWGAVGAAVLILIPIVAIMVGGISLMGSHKYKANLGWKVKLVNVNTTGELSSNNENVLR